jgi:hypothetical protein
MRSIFSVQQKRTAQLVLVAACLGVYAPALYAPVDPQTGQGSRQIVFNMGTVIDEIETKIDAIIAEMGSTFTQLNTLESKVDVIDAEVGLAQSTIEVVESKLDDCCATLNSKLDEVFVDFQETWTIIGNQDQQSSASGDFTNAADIDAAQLTVIEWLKTIYRQQRGF